MMVAKNHIKQDSNDGGNNFGMILVTITKRFFGTFLAWKGVWPKQGAQRATSPPQVLESKYVQYYTRHIAQCKYYTCLVIV